MSPEVDALSLRLATEGDDEAISEVHVAGWMWAYRGQLPDAFLEGISVERRRNLWRATLAAPDSDVRVWVAQIAGRIVGFAAAGPSREGAGAELMAIYLLEDVAGSGVGGSLLERVTADLVERGFREACLWVLGSNARARSFYEKAGWKPDGTSKTEHVGEVELREVRYRRALA